MAQSTEDDPVPDNQVVSNGFIDPAFEKVRLAFEENFALHNEVGASVAVFVNGDCVVDLVGGIADTVLTTPYTHDTTQVIFSTTKGATTMCALVLVDRGLLDLDAPVAKYWPEFAANGKGAIPVRWLLSHKAGLPGLKDLSNLDMADLLAVQPFVDRLGAETPWWEPGTGFGYHALTFGYLAGELIRRVSGVTVGRFFANEIAEPLGLSFNIGLSEDDPAYKNVAPNIYSVDSIGGFAKAMAPAADGESMDVTVQRMVLRTLDYDPSLGRPPMEAYNSPAIRGTENPSASGIANGQAIAKLYAAALGDVPEHRLFSEETLSLALTSQTDGLPDVMAGPSSIGRFGIGFMLTNSGRALLGEDSFGHFGAGGSVGVASKPLHCSVGYVPNRMSSRMEQDVRAVSILNAVRECLS